MPQVSTYTGGLVETNAHLITLPGGTVLVDAPEGVDGWLADLGVKVDTLLLTHQHFDHVMGAAAVHKGHGCKIHAWSAFDRGLTLETFFGAMTGGFLSVPEFQVDVLLEGRASVEAAGARWGLFHIPGHSPDSVCFHLEEEGMLFGGDVLFRDGYGRTDFPGGSFRKLSAGARIHLSPLPPETVVYPGHGPETTIRREVEGNPLLAED